MKNETVVKWRKALPAVVAAFLFQGCSTGRNMGVTNMEQPGPVIGHAIGAGTGAVAGNVAGGVVGLGEGFGSTAKFTFDNTQRTVRYWHEEKTADGRAIMVSEIYLVDANGRIIRKVQ